MWSCIFDENDVSDIIYCANGFLNYNNEECYEIKLLYSCLEIVTTDIFLLFENFP